MASAPAQDVKNTLQKAFLNSGDVETAKAIAAISVTDIHDQVHHHAEAKLGECGSRSMSGMGRSVGHEACCGDMSSSTARLASRCLAPARVHIRTTSNYR